MSTIIRILVSLAGLGIVVWVLQGIDLAETGRAVLDARLPYLGAGLVLVGASVFLRTLRWKYMLAPRKSISLRTLVGPLAIGYAVGNVTATGLGAIPRSILITRKEGVPTSYVLGTVIFEFILDAAVVVTWADVVTFFVDLPAPLVPVRYLLAFFAVIIYMTIFAFMRRRSMLLRALPIDRLAPLAARVPQEIRLGWSGFQEGISTFLNDPPILARVTVTTLLVWVVESLMFWVLMLSVGIPATLSEGSIVMAFTHVVIGVPSLPGFVGTLDAAALATLGMLGLEGVRALSYTLIVHAYLIVPLTIAGGLAAWHEGITLSWGKDQSIGP